ncbi:MAG: hypothetical protein ABWZ80_07885 [Beijerinckiaceae bacterium]
MAVARDSLLTNDYVNHFAELVMLLELVIESPHLIEDIRNWTPRSYCEHIGRIGFEPADSLRQAYERLEPARRAMLDAVSGDANRLGAALRSTIADANVAPARLPGIVRIGCEGLHDHIRRLAAILANKPLAQIERNELISQSDIDALLAAA